MQPPHSRLLQHIAPIVLGVAVVNGASAANWTTSAAVAPGITYTDNVCLTRDDERGEWVGLMTPSGSIKGNGNKGSVDLRGSLQLNTLTDSRIESIGCNTQGFGRSRQQFAPNITGKADAVLIDDWLYVDATARADQNEVTSRRSGGGDSLNTTGNTNTFYRYSVSPYIQRRFKNVANLKLRYSWDQQFNSEDVVGDSTQTSVLGTFGNSARTSPVSWSLEGRATRVEYDENRFGSRRKDTELKSARINLGYQLGRAWQVNGFWGQEWNDIQTISRKDQDGAAWDLGLRWSPTTRTTVEVGTGNRFFGNTPRFSIKHRHKRSDFSADYSKVITFDRNIRTGGNARNASDLSDGPLLDERFTLGYSLSGRLSSVSVSGSHSEQTRSGDLRKSTFKSIDVSVTRTLSSRLSVSANIGWDDDESEGILDDFLNNDNSDQADTWRLGLGVHRPLNQSMGLSFDYLYTDRRADRESNEYQENRVTVTLRINL